MPTIDKLLRQNNKTIQRIVFSSIILASLVFVGKPVSGQVRELHGETVSTFTSVTNSDESFDRLFRRKTKDAVKKALPYIKKNGDSWLTRLKCMSCHRVSFTAWSHLEASKAGVETSNDDVDRWIKWNHGNLFEPFPKKDQKVPGEKTIQRNLSGAAQMLFVTASQSKKEYLEADKEILSYLEKGQTKNGSWAPKGQLPGQKRPLKETAQVITHWNSLGLLALKDRHPELEPRVMKLISKAKGYSKDFQNGKSSEWLAVRTLFDLKVSRTESAKEMLDRLMTVRNKDGGWGWIAKKKSDNLATSQILYVLTEVRKQRPDWVSKETLLSVAEFLLKKQGKKGVWVNRGTKTEMKGRIEPTASYWATCWAVISLSRLIQDGA